MPHCRQLCHTHAYRILAILNAREGRANGYVIIVIKHVVASDD